MVTNNILYKWDLADGYSFGLVAVLAHELFIPFAVVPEPHAARLRLS